MGSVIYFDWSLGIDEDKTLCDYYDGLTPEEYQDIHEETVAPKCGCDRLDMCQNRTNCEKDKRKQNMQSEEDLPF